MASTLLLDVGTWDLVLDANGNIALATEPYSLAQDAASAIKTLLGECYWDTTVGVPLFEILGQQFSLALTKTLCVTAAITVPDVASAQVFISSFDRTSRIITGQVQITSTSGQSSAANFTTAVPQGAG
jgi:hypothetical protein